MSKRHLLLLHRVTECNRTVAADSGATFDHICGNHLVEPFEHEHGKGDEVSRFGFLRGAAGRHQGHKADDTGGGDVVQVIKRVDEFRRYLPIRSGPDRRAVHGDQPCHQFQLGQGG